MNRTVAVFAGTRADVHPLGPVLAALAEAPDLDATLLSPPAVDAPDIPREDLDVELDVRTAESMATAGARLAVAMATALHRLEPDACVVLGDRWELLYAVPPVVLAGVPLIHLHGGEITEGAIDDRVRHAVTKLADWHCVSTADAAARVRQLGEPADRVMVTGAPSLDRTAQVMPADDRQLSELLGAQLRRPFALVTYHPATAGGPAPGVGARNVLAAVAATVGSAVITHPGLDPGRDEILAAIGAAVEGEPQLAEIASLGSQYLPVLAAADVVVGNSSSGIIEAASFGVPVVNVGDRQRGRARSANAIDAIEDENAIQAAIRRALTAEFRAQARESSNVYGDGKAAPRIVDVIRRAIAAGVSPKPFVDLG